MTKKHEKLNFLNSFPKDEQPVIIVLNNDLSYNYVGRYIANQSIFMLSLNDDCSEFIPSSEVKEWHYIFNHPIIINECSINN